MFKSVGRRENDGNDDDIFNYYNYSEDQTHFFKQSNASTETGAEMSGIEQTLEYFDWTGRDSSRGLEQQILRELELVNNAIVYSVTEPDDRTRELTAVLDKAIGDCASLEHKLKGYKARLQVLADNLDYLDASEAR
ncbi:hypothetical protein V1512DRAFT_247677 [Lipomyces arxii]|uniref:uncharacterized protein n=1 Tax=Lipomyces arxii TaxID=56418 RepID=UPI0034CFE221